MLKQEAPEEGLLGGPTVGKLPPAHPAPHLSPKRGLEAGLEREDPAVLPAPCPVVQSRTPIPLDLGLDHAVHLRKGIVPVTRRAAPALRPVPHPGPLTLRLTPLPGGGGTRIPRLTLAHGVAPGRGLDPLREHHSGVEAGRGAAPQTNLAMVRVQNQLWNQ